MLALTEDGRYQEQLRGFLWSCSLTCVEQRASALYNSTQVRMAHPQTEVWLVEMNHWNRAVVVYQSSFYHRHAQRSLS
jgi:hypothetical protein